MFLCHKCLIYMRVKPLFVLFNNNNNLLAFLFYIKKKNRQLLACISTLIVANVSLFSRVCLMVFYYLTSPPCLKNINDIKMSRTRENSEYFDRICHVYIGVGSGAVLGQRFFFINTPGFFLFL